MGKMITDERLGSERRIETMIALLESYCFKFRVKVHKRYSTIVLLRLKFQFVWLVTNKVSYIPM